MARNFDLVAGTEVEMSTNLAQRQDGKTNRPLKWLDDYYLWSDAGDRLRLVEFDGQNERDITSVARGYDVSLSPTGHSLFSIGKNAVTGAYSLQISPLIID